MLKTIKSGIYSLCIGSTVFLFGGIFFADKEIQTTIVSVMLMSFIFGLLSLIYEAEKISFFFKSLIHIFGSYVAFLIVAYINKWFPFNFTIIIVASGIFLTIFMLIWFVFYQNEKKSVAAINQHLSEK